MQPDDRPRWFVIAWEALLGSLQQIVDENVPKETVKELFLAALKCALDEGVSLKVDSAPENQYLLSSLEANPSLVIVRKPSTALLTENEGECEDEHKEEVPIGESFSREGRKKRATWDWKCKVLYRSDVMKHDSMFHPLRILSKKDIENSGRLKQKKILRVGECSVVTKKRKKKKLTRMMIPIDPLALEDSTSLRDSDLPCDVDGIFDCEYTRCHLSFATKEARFTHQIREHMISRRSDGVAKRRFPCVCPVRLCPATISFTDSLAHISEHHAGIDGEEWLRMVSYSCKIEGCIAYFEKEADFVKHSKDLHNAEPAIKCPQCEKCFYTDIRLGDHIKIRHEKRFESMCEWCSKTFPTHSKLTFHIKSKHTGDLPSVCDVCEKRFVNDADMRYHKKLVHVTERSYVCEQCGASYKTTGSLRRHYKKHSEVRPFECHICARRFKSNVNLKGHYRSHSDERPHGCELCGRRFKEKYALRYHEQKNHGINNGLKLFQQPHIISIPVTPDIEVKDDYLEVEAVSN